MSDKMAKKTTLDEMIEQKELLLSGHTACPGCGSVIGLRYVLKALGENTALVVPACCASIYQTLWPNSSFGVHTYNTAFASAAAVASGLKRGLKAKGHGDVNVAVWGGDGGIIDIGFATVSGAAERNEDILVICYDNEGYMNTGIQRSGSTPPGARTTTTWKGKPRKKKLVPFIMLMHGIPYVATANLAYPVDLYEKVKKAREISGFRYIHILCSCPSGWRVPEAKIIEVLRLANETGYWPLWESERVDEKTEVKLSQNSKRYVNPEKRKSLDEYLEIQNRFKAITEEQKRLIKSQIDDLWNMVERFSTD